MQHSVFLITGLLGLGLQVMVIHAMTKGAYKQYVGLFLYVLVLFFTSVSNFSAFLDTTSFEGWYERIYHWNNISCHLTAFLAVVSMYFTATAASPRRVAYRVYILAGATVIISFTFLIQFQSGILISLYFQRVGRNLSLITVVMNLLLWFALIKTRTPDKLLLIISGGMGLNMTGEAIGQTIMQMGTTDVVYVLANLVSVGSHLLCLLIWWRAFSTYNQAVRATGRLAS